MAEHVETPPPWNLQALVDVDSPVVEAACLTDKVAYLLPDGAEVGSIKGQGRHQTEEVEIVHNVKPFRQAVSILHNRLLSIQKKFSRPVRVLVSNGDSNYRYGVCPDYKGNRPPGSPWWIPTLREWLVNSRWRAEVSPPYMETDDVLAEEQLGNTGSVPTCIVSKDKDLGTVEGWHYNYSKPEEGLYHVTSFEAFKFFCTQMLAGDGADNIKGLPYCTPVLRDRYGLTAQALNGCGMGSARKMLEGAETKEELIRRVREGYDEVYGDPERAFIEMTRAAQLLRMGWRTTW